MAITTIIFASVGIAFGIANPISFSLWAVSRRVTLNARWGRWGRGRGFGSTITPIVSTSTDVALIVADAVSTPGWAVVSCKVGKTPLGDGWGGYVAILSLSLFAVCDVDVTIAGSFGVAWWFGGRWSLGGTAKKSIRDEYFVRIGQRRQGLPKTSKYSPLWHSGKY